MGFIYGASFLTKDAKRHKEHTHLLNWQKCEYTFRLEKRGAREVRGGSRGREPKLGLRSGFAGPPYYSPTRAGMAAKKQMGTKTSGTL